MKKVFYGSVIIFILALGAVVFYGISNLDALIKAAIEKYGSEATQTAVRVDQVRIKVTEGDGAIHGLTVANAGGFDGKYAFSLGEIGLGIDIQSLKQEPYVINHVTVRAPQVFVEVNNDNQTNLHELSKNLTGGPSSKSTSGKPAAEQAAGKQPRLIINRLTFEEGKIAARIMPLKKDYSLKLPSIHMNKLGGSQGATPAELAKEILKRLTDAASEEIKKKGIDAEIEKLKAQVQEKIDAEKAKVEAQVEAEKARLKEETASKLEAEKRKAEEKLKGLFQ